MVLAKDGRRTWLGSCSSKAKVEGTCDHLSQLGRRRPSSICLFGCLGLSQRQWRGKGQWQGRLGWLGYQYTWHWHDRLDLAGLAPRTCWERCAGHSSVAVWPRAYHMIVCAKVEQHSSRPQWDLLFDFSLRQALAMFQYASSRGDSLAKAMAEQLEANVGKSPAGTNTVSETTSSRFRNYDYTIQKLQVQAQHDPTCNSLLQSHSLPLRSVCVTIELYIFKTSPLPKPYMQ